MNSLEGIFSSWAQSPGTTEAEKCKNAERAIKKAIAADSKLSRLDVTVFAQGSYKARTNVKQDSDVDVCVHYNEAWFAHYPDGKTDKDFGEITEALKFTDFKDMVGKALASYFGVSTVTRGNKAFDIHENSYRIDADVVPTFQHRRYTGNINPDRTYEFHAGVAFIPDQGDLIINWPEQNYENGVQPHDGTIVFEIVGTPVEKLKGVYWTARKSTGEVSLRFREKRLLEEFPKNFGVHPVSGKRQ